LYNMNEEEKIKRNKKIEINYYLKTIKFNKEYYYIYINISTIYIKEEKYKKAIEILSEGIYENPYEEDLYYNRACSYSILNMEELAIKDIRKILILNPNSISWIKKDIDFNNLYNNEEFKRILKDYTFNL